MHFGTIIIIYIYIVTRKLKSLFHPLLQTFVLTNMLISTTTYKPKVRNEFVTIIFENIT